MNRKVSFLVGFLAGVVVGAALAVLAVFDEAATSVHEQSKELRRVLKHRGELQRRLVRYGDEQTIREIEAEMIGYPIPRNPN